MRLRCGGMWRFRVRGEIIFYDYGSRRIRRLSQIRRRYFRVNRKRLFFFFHFCLWHKSRAKSHGQTNASARLTGHAHEQALWKVTAKPYWAGRSKISRHGCYTILTALIFYGDVLLKNKHTRRKKEALKSQLVIVVSITFRNSNVKALPDENEKDWCEKIFFESHPKKRFWKHWRLNREVSNFTEITFGEIVPLVRNALFIIYLSPFTSHVSPPYYLFIQ